MRLFLAALAAALSLGGPAFGQPDAKFLRGAKPSPRAKVAAAPRHTVYAAPPAQFAMVPPKLSYWKNDTYGDCVTAEEAFAKAAWSVYCGLPETFVPDSEVVRWASAHGILNGAALTDTLDAMQRDGFRVDGKVYTNGGYAAVDYSNDLALKSALTVGPVKIAIDANALPRGAGNAMGWYKLGGGRFPNTDHCVALCGYGPASFCFDQIHTPLPAGLKGDTQGYLLFTWNTIGFVDKAWLDGTCVEAWVRNPTTTGQVPPVNPPTPPVPPTPPAPPGPPPAPGTTVVVDPLTRTVTVPADWTVVGGKQQPCPPAADAAAVSAAIAAGKVNPYVILADALQIYVDYNAKNYVAVAADVAKLLADLGIAPTPTTAVPQPMPSTVPGATLYGGPCYVDPATGQTVCPPQAPPTRLRDRLRPHWIFP